MSARLELLLAIHGLPALGLSERLRLAEALSRPEELAGVRGEDLRVAGASGRRAALLRGPLAPDVFLVCERARRGVAWIERLGIRILSHWDEDFPAALREIHDPPFLLFCRGTVPDWGSPALAVVGTRAPTGRGRTAAYRLGAECAHHGLPVVSGLALGIDEEAHRGCVDAGAQAIAVLGNGADTVYPRSSRALADRILDAGGCLLTEYGPGEPVRPFHFPARNRLISGLSRSVVVIEAPEKSGALITAAFALEQGRDLYVHADGLSGDAGSGLRRLEQEGATVIRSCLDIINDWALQQPKSQDPAEAPDLARLGCAELLALELAGRVTLRNGEYFWRG